MMIKYLTLGIAISFMSWIIGMIINGILIKTKSYKSISNLHFITNKTLNKNIGIDYFKWIVTNSFFKFFNQNIKVDNKKTKLMELRKEMTIAEISHLIGFLFVTLIALYKSITENYLSGLLIMLVNVLMNLYPSLLQQENKRRIDLLIKRQTKTAAKDER